MEPEKGRWMLVILGMVINLCLGSIYSWSVFVGPLTNYFTKDLGQVVSASEILLPFSVFLAFFAIAMPFTGKYIEKYGPRNITIVGGMSYRAWLAPLFICRLCPVALHLLWCDCRYRCWHRLWSPCCRCSPLVPRSPWTRGWTDPARVRVLCTPYCQYCRIPHRCYGVMNTFRIFGIAFIILIDPARTAPEIPASRVETCRMDTPCTGSRSGSHLRIQTRADA